MMIDGGGVAPLRAKPRHEALSRECSTTHLIGLQPPKSTSRIPSIIATITQIVNIFLKISVFLAI